MTRAATLIDHAISEDPTNAVKRTLAQAKPPGIKLRCCRPTCAKEFEWSRAGRVPRFCSDKCRVYFTKERTLLTADLEAYERLLECPMTWEESVEIRSRISVLKGRLSRYRPFEP